jgi:integrase
MKQRCILNDNLISKYKFPSPSATSTVSQSCSGSRPTSDTFRRNLFVEEETKLLPGPPIDISSPGSSYAELKTHTYEDEERLTVNEEALARTMKRITQEHQVFEEVVDELGENTSAEGEDGGRRQEKMTLKRKLKKKRAEDDKTTKEPEEPEEHQDEEEETSEGLERHKPQIERGNTKKYYCPFCRQLYSKFARHLIQVHGSEKEVNEVKALSANHPERKKIIARLRAEGSRIYNSIQSSPKKMIVPRQKMGTNINEYIACYMCGASYKQRFLHRHVKVCPSAEGTPIHNPLRTSKMQKFSSTEESHMAIQFSRDVLSGIREGEVKQAISTDPLLKQYGLYMCSLYGNEKHLINLIRRKLRQISEVLLEMRKLDKDVVRLDEIFTTKSTLFQAIKNVTGYADGNFKRPAMANELGTLLQHCARRFICKLLEENQNEKVKEVKRWIELVKSDYNALISKHARKDLDEGKWNKPKTLPLTEDLIKLNTFVKKTSDDALEILEREFKYEEWENLNKATMIKILIFNRKRVGDVQRIRIEDIKKAHNIQKGSITYNLLTESEKVTCSKYLRVEVRGKHAKVVPMLLTKEMLANVKKIISLRKQAGIPETNRFVFAKNKDEPFAASAALRSFALNCGAKCPRFLTGTKLRQEIATATQAFNFSENDLSVLANYLGHTLQTHRQFYRLPDEAIQLAKISKVLEIVDSGKAAEIRGKSLTELENYVTSRLEEVNVEGKWTNMKFFL